MYELQASGYHFSRDRSYYLDEFEGLSVAHNFAGGQNDNNSKDSFATSRTFEILNSLKDWVSSCDVDFKRETLKKIDSALLCGVTVNTWQR